MTEQSELSYAEKLQFLAQLEWDVEKFAIIADIEADFERLLPKDIVTDLGRNLDPARVTIMLDREQYIEGCKLMIRRAELLGMGATVDRPYVLQYRGAEILPNGEYGLVPEQDAR